MRKLVTTLAVAATTAAAASAGPAPASAEAAGCTWKLPSRTLVYQGSNSFTLVKRDGVYTVDRRPLAEVTLDSVKASRVRFIITWGNGTAGVYKGTIDEDGFVEGTTYDRRNPGSTARWEMDRLARCV